MKTKSLILILALTMLLALVAFDWEPSGRARGVPATQPAAQQQNVGQSDEHPAPTATIEPWPTGWPTPPPPPPPPPTPTGVWPPIEPPYPPP